MLLNIVLIVSMLVIVSIAGMSYFLISAAKEDPCGGVGSSFKEWCNICSIRDWPSADGAPQTMVKCMQKLYNRTVSTCDVARQACAELAGVS